MPDMNDEAEVRRNNAELQKRVAELEDAIAERKRAEEELSEAKNIINRSPVVAFLWGKEEDWYVEFASDNVGKLFGYSAQEFMERKISYSEIIHSDDLERVTGEVASYSKKEGLQTFKHEPYRIIVKNGDVKWIDDITYIRRDSRGIITHYEGIVYDITEREKVKKELLRQKLQYQGIFEASKDTFLIFDLKGVIREVNPAACEMYGYSYKELIGLSGKDIVHPDYQHLFKKFVKEASAGRTFSAESVDIRKGGSTFDIEVRGSAFEFKGEPHLLAVVRDITARKRAEEEMARIEDQYRQAQKMESVGRLAGSVAHDFNNMLGVILGCTELALDEVDPAQPVFAALQEIRTAAERSADLTRQLLAFARRQTVSPRILDLNETVEVMLKMLRRLIGEDIDLAWLPGAGLWPLKVDPAQIDQMLANLCINAQDAIVGVGKMTIETRNVTLDEVYCADHPGFVPGEYVLMAVIDDGCGMDKETQDMLFEPFFTTKGVGQGTGLGLATVYGIVKQNNGFINVYSELGKGTTFSIYLPRHTGRAAQIQKEGQAEPVRHGHETILLVEDEPAILRITTTMLERQGYTVLPAATPGEAIRLAGEYTSEIHLLMTDVVMPEMNGRELAKNLVSLYPDLKRLFMSGYTADVIAHHGVLNVGVNFIQKPFGMQDLAAKVREALYGK